MDVLDGDLLLTLAAVTIERIKKRCVAAGQLAGLI
jgi:hypothetical protein